MVENGPAVPKKNGGLRRPEPVLSENSIVVSQHDLRVHQNTGMTPDFLRLRLLLATFAGWVTRDQAQVIAYLVEENRVLKDHLRGRRLRLRDTRGHHADAVHANAPWLLTTRRSPSLLPAKMAPRRRLELRTH